MKDLKRSRSGLADGPVALMLSPRAKANTTSPVTYIEIFRHDTYQC